MTRLSLTLATHDDLAVLHPIIERAYRGDAARLGWTHEADLVSGARIDPGSLAAIIEDDDERLLVARADDAIAGCVQISRLTDSRSYLGLLCVDPLLQAGGIGKFIIAEAEACAANHFGARVMEMTVIASRAELIAYYQRRGYRLTGETRPFPITFDPPLSMMVLEKALA